MVTAAKIPALPTSRTFKADKSLPSWNCESFNVRCLIPLRHDSLIHAPLEFACWLCARPQHISRAGISDAIENFTFTYDGLRRTANEVPDFSRRKDRSRVR